MRSLPPAWYSTVPELSHEWGCHPDRLFYYMDSGQLVPSVLLPKAKIDTQAGAAPSVCLVLEDFQGIAWQHSEGDAQASLAGDYTGFYVDGGGFRVIEISLAEPVLFSRRDLVVIDSNREAFENLFVPASARKPNRAKERATALVIRALLQKAYPTDLEHPYRVATKIAQSIELMGATISRNSGEQDSGFASGHRNGADTQRCKARVT